MQFGKIRLRVRRNAYGDEWVQYDGAHFAIEWADGTDKIAPHYRSADTSKAEYTATTPVLAMRSTTYQDGGRRTLMLYRFPEGSEFLGTAKEVA